MCVYIYICIYIYVHIYIYRYIFFVYFYSTPPSRICASSVCSSQVLYFGLLFCITEQKKPQSKAVSVRLDRKHP